jgi:hypothetical protein
VRYAQNTVVSVERSRAEVEGMIVRYGADSFGVMSNAKKTTIVFKCKNRTIRFEMPMPVPPAAVEKWGKDRELSDAQKDEYVSDENRRRWRALLLVIKAKLESVESGIATFEDEFLAYTVMQNGQTVGQWARPQLDTAKGIRPQLLLGESE